MARQAVLNLLRVERLALQKIASRGENWRERQRAQILILLDDGLSLSEVAAAVGVHARTAGSTRLAWLKDGLESLPDLARCGAPRKLTGEQIEKLVELARNEPHSARALLARHVDGGGTPVHLNTLTTALRAAGLVWKRTRHSLKKRSEAAFRSSQAEIQVLRAQAAAGHMVLAYVDEAGFSQAHPNRSAWTPRGQCHLIQATRGKRLNVLGAMLSSGALFTAKLWQATRSDAFVGFLGLLKEQVTMPLTVILDNASIHKAKSIQPIIEHLNKQGLTLYFLPPYCPELNRIERLWHKIKYTWMAAKSRDPRTLQADVDDILSNFGTKYKFAF